MSDSRRSVLFRRFEPGKPFERIEIFVRPQRVLVVLGQLAVRLDVSRVLANEAFHQGDCRIDPAVLEIQLAQRHHHRCREVAGRQLRFVPASTPLRTRDRGTGSAPARSPWP